MVAVALLITAAGVVVAVTLVQAATSSPINTSQTANTQPAIVPVLQPTGAASTAAATPSAAATSGLLPLGNVSSSVSPSTAPTITITATVTAYEADSAANILAGSAHVGSCPACPDGKKVRFLGNGGTLTFPNVTVASAGDYTLTIVYIDGDTNGGRTALVSVNATATTVYFAGNGDWNTTQTLTMTVHLAVGANRVEFSNPQAPAPDIAEITA
jgi:hypothetical protein